MDAVFQYEIPVWHPLVVHLPIVAILLGAFAVGIWAVRPNPYRLRSGMMLYGIGVLGGLVAYFTGDPMLEQTEGEPIVDMLSPLHEDLALYALVFTALTLAGLFVYGWYDRRVLALHRDGWSRGLMRAGLALLAFLAALLILATAHVGGTMVWGVAR